jgi:integrase
MDEARRRGIVCEPFLLIGYGSQKGRNTVSVFKRKNRDGSLSKYYSYDFWIDDVRYRGAIKHARTKAQAERAETKIRDSVYEGKYGKTVQAPNFKAFVEKTYLPYSRANKRSWRHDEFRARPLIAFFGRKRLDEISQVQIERYKRERQASKTKHGENRSPASINRELELLSAVFTYALDMEIAVIPNPCRKVKRLDEDNERTRYLAEEEEERLMAQLIDRRKHLHRIVTLAIHTLMRKSELLSLRKVNLDFQRNIIWVVNSRRERTKGKKGRPIPMNSIARQELWEQCQSNNSEYVFPSDSKSGHLEDIKTSFNGACEDAKIEDFLFHDLRRTGATRLAEAGADAFYIQALLGHADIKTSQIYALATSRGLREAVESLARRKKETVAIFPTQQEKEILATAVNG